MPEAHLIPTFFPPKPAFFRNPSDFDKCKIILSMIQQKKENKNRMVLPSKDLMPSQRLEAEEAKPSTISLFGGDITYHTSGSSQAIRTKKDMTAKRKHSEQPALSHTSISMTHHPAPQQLLISDLLSPDSEEVPAKRQRSAPKEPKVSACPPASSAVTSVSTTRKAVSADSHGQQRIMPAIRAEDFAECSSFCRNAACSPQGLAALSSLCLAAASISVAIVWQDATCNHVTTTTKHCTPSRPCYTWYCSCDRHIKAQRATAHLLGLVLCLNGRQEHIYLLPLAPCSNEASQPTTLPIKAGTTLDERWRFVYDLLQSPVPKISYNSQLLLLPILYNNHKMLCRNLYDVKIAAFLTNTDASDTDLNLEALFKHYHVESQVLSSLRGEVSKTLQYLHGDLSSLFTLYDALHQELAKIKALSIFQTLECPTAVLLAKMEITGIMIDCDASAYIASEAQRLSATLSREATEVTGEAFNLGSPEQVAHILYEKLKLAPANSSSGKKHASTSEEDLLRIIDKHPVVELILHYRNASKLLHTTIHGMEAYITTDLTDSSCKRVYATWNQTAVRTGRLSCSKPNLQNIPNAKVIRNVVLNPRSLFVASQNRVLLSADYSQIEVRVLAQMCKDGQLTALFKRSGDIYRTLAAIIFDQTEGSVTDDERNRAKVICLGVLYGMGPQAAAAKLGIDSKTAQSIMTSFFKKFPTVSKWIQTVKRQAKVDKYVQTLLGRVRHLSDITSSDAAKRSQSERQAVNSIIQGSASDIIKLAMLMVDEAIRAADGQPPRLLMQIHDELIYEVLETQVNTFAAQLKNIMELQLCSKLHFDVPLLIKMNYGISWGDMKPIAIVNDRPARSID